MLDQFLSSIDLFGTPIVINFSRKEKFKSSCGGICTLIFCGFVLWTIYNESLNLFSKSNPNSVLSESFAEDPSEIVITPDTFPMAFGLQAPDSLEFIQFYDESIYKLNLYHVRQERITDNDGNATLNVIYTDIATEICTPDHFGELGPSFATLSLDLLYCIAKEQPIMQTISISGTPESMLYEALTVRVSPCNNDTSSITCSTQERINEYLDGSWFYAYYSNMAVDPKNYTRPDVRYRDAFYAMIGPSNYRYSIFNLGHVDVITDSGWIVETANTQNYAKLDYVQDFAEFKPHPEKLLITFDIQLSKLEKYYYRSYTKIQDVLAGAGGLANAVLIGLVIFTAPFLKVKFYESIMNERFDIDFSGLADSKKKAKQKKKKSKDENKKKQQKNIVEDKDEPFSSNNYLTRTDAKFNYQQDEKNCQMISLESPTVPNFSPKYQAELQVLDEAPPVKGLRIALHNSSQKESGIITNLEELPLPISLQIEKNSTSEIARLKKKLRKLSAKLIEQPLDNLQSKDVSFFSDFSGEVGQSPSLNNSKLDAENGFEDQNKEKDRAVKESDVHIRKRLEENSKINSDQGAEAEDMNDDIIPIESNSNTATPQKLHIGFFEFFFSCLGRSKKTKYKIALVEEGRKNIEERLDVLNLILKLREIDQILFLMFDKDQLTLFDSLPKPQISLKKPEHARPSVDFLLKNTSLLPTKGKSDERQRALDRIINKPVKDKVDTRIVQACKDAFKIPGKSMDYYQ